MTTDKPSAVVLGPSEMKNFTGVEGLFGACLINEGVGQCFIYTSKDELLAGVLDYDVCPSGYSDNVAILSSVTEFDAIAQIVDFATSKAPELRSLRNAGVKVSTFIDYGPRYYRGVTTKLTSFGLDVMISVRLADSIGWREGDKLNLVVSPCGKFLGIEKCDHGPELTRAMSEPENYVLDRVFSNLPLFIDLADQDWKNSAYHLLDDRVLVSSNISVTDKNIAKSDSLSVVFSEQSSPRVRQGVSTKAFLMLIGVLSAALVGSLILALG